MADWSNDPMLALEALLPDIRGKLEEIVLLLKEIGKGASGLVLG